MYYVYLMASRKHGTLYTGVTNDLIRRAWEHRTGAVKGFTSRYHVHLLVWFECCDDPLGAIAREKQIKKWHREWKINLVERTNPEWIDPFETLARWTVAMDSGLAPSARPGMTGRGCPCGVSSLRGAPKERRSNPGARQ